MASKKCLIAWAIFLVFVLFLTSQVTARPDAGVDPSDSPPANHGHGKTPSVTGRLLAGFTFSQLYRVNWDEWLYCNLNNKNHLTGNVPYYMYFVFFVFGRFGSGGVGSFFDNEFSIPSSPHAIIFKNARYWWQAIDTSINTSTTAGVSKIISWIPLDQGWTKLNIDGSRDNIEGNIAAGGVLRDDAKQWIVGFALNRGKGSALNAELWGSMKGFNCAGEVVIGRSLLKLIAKLLWTSSTQIISPFFSIV